MVVDFIYSSGYFEFKQNYTIFHLPFQGKPCIIFEHDIDKASFMYKKGKTVDETVEYASGQVCAARHREPCQAGNRAALSGSSGAMQVACPFTYSTIDRLAFVMRGRRREAYV